MNPENSVPDSIKHPGPNPAWLSLLTETVLEPDRPIVDSHHHFWTNTSSPYLLEDFLGDVNMGHNIVASVYLQVYSSHRTDGPQSMRPVGETEYIVATAEEADRRGISTRVCAGIVGYADLTLGANVEPVLAAHIEAGKGRFRGIRYITARHPKFNASITVPPAFGLMRSKKFREGFATLSKFNLSFDAWLYFTQIDQLVDLARSFPQTPIVFNHTGGPLGFGSYTGRREETYQQWREGLRLLASCHNVSIKLGGLGMISSGFDFHRNPLPPSSGELATAWSPYILEAIEIFGVDRCMFESNFPVEKCCCSYVSIWNAFKRIVHSATEDEKNALFQGTAKQFYKI